MQNPKKITNVLLNLAFYRKFETLHAAHSAYVIL